MATTRLPLVTHDDVVAGVYLVDDDSNKLYQVLLITEEQHEGKLQRVALLENCVTDEVETFSFPGLVAFRVVPHG